MIIDLYERYGDEPHELLVKFNPDMQVKFCRDLERVFFGKAPVIGIVALAYGRETAEAWLICQLNDMSAFAGCKEKLSKRQINETAAIIAERYGHYKFTEFMYFCQKFKCGEYGKFYGAVDPMVILEALGDFNEERAWWYERHRAELEKAERDRLYDENAALRQRYRKRVPDADTDKAPINFLQYRLMGFDSMTDDELAEKLDALRTGREEIPERALDIIELLKSTHGITE